MQILFRFADSL